MSKIITQGKVLNKSQTKVAFLKEGALSSPTPLWAKWIFRGTTVLTTVIAFWIVSTSLVDENIKVEIGLALKSIDLLVLGLSKMVGIVPNEN